VSKSDSGFGFSASNRGEEMGMSSWIFSLIVASPLLASCGASVPPPTQRMADAQSAHRSAQELGANEVPEAQLSLKLAGDQIAMAEKEMGEGENARAESLLIRAQADAELAIARAREEKSSDDVKEAVTDSAAQKATNVGQGAVK
jgi:hypothetical protein